MLAGHRTSSPRKAKVGARARRSATFSARTNSFCRYFQICHEKWSHICGATSEFRPSCCDLRHWHVRCFVV